MTDKALLFSGQGAQAVGMGRDLAEAYPECRELYERADAALGYGLSGICFQGPEDQLTRSNHCQPAIFVTSMVCYTALKRECPDLAPRAVAGLSLGEWTALHMAGALSFEDTLTVLEARGRFMQEACEEREGAMVSIIGLPMEALQTICESTGVEVANLNSPAQTVLSGERQAIEETERQARAAGAKRAVMLKVAGAFHSSLMAHAAERLTDVLASVEIVSPSVPVLADFTGLPHDGPDDIRRAMLGQITGTVRWQDCIEWMAERGVDTFVECGPGQVLTGLVKRINQGAALHNVQDTDSLKMAAERLAV